MLVETEEPPHRTILTEPCHFDREKPTMTTFPTPRGPRPGGTWRFADRDVARIGYGAMQLERLHTDPAAASALLRRAVELGVDHIDTADFYRDGFVNDVIRRTLRPEEALVATKIGAVAHAGGPIPLRPAQRPEDLRASVETNLRGLGRERIDVVNLRRVAGGIGIRAEGDQVVDLDDQLAAMVVLRDEGKIGAIGLSNVSRADVRRALPVGVACVQNAYSLVSRDDESLLELCVDEGVAWVPFFPLGGAFPGLPKVTESAEVHRVAADLGATPSQIGLAWLLQHAPNTLLIPGTATTAHLVENVATGYLHLPAAVVADLDTLTLPPGRPSRGEPAAPGSTPGG